MRKPSALKLSILYLSFVFAFGMPDKFTNIDAARFTSGDVSGDVSGIQCPAVQSSHSVLLPHPTECGKFYICDRGVPHLKTCQPPLFFNPKTQSCDYPGNVACNTGSTTVPREPSENRLCPAAPTVDHKPVLKPHESDCGKFYICDGGVPHLKTCKNGLHFNQKLKTCDYPSNAECETGNDNQSEEDDTDLKEGGKPSGRCPKGQTDRPVLISDPSSCSKFVMCDRGVSYPKSCPSGLHFNPSLQTCDFPERAKCEKMGLLLSAGIPSPFCPTISGNIEIFFRHPSNCSVYYMCSHGLAYEFACPARLHFNMRQKICDYEWLARCSGGETEED